MKMTIKIIYTLLLFNISIAMSQNSDNTSKNVITQGYLIGTGSEIIENKLTLSQHLNGIAGSTWIFEISNNKLIILTFFWGVKPNAKPELNNIFNITSKGIVNSKKTINVEYKFHQSNDKIISKNWIQLIGNIDEYTKINIKKVHPYYTNIKNIKFIKLLNKYNMEIGHQTQD